MFFTLSEHVVENIIGEYKKPIQPMHPVFDDKFRDSNLKPL